MSQFQGRHNRTPTSSLADASDSKAVLKMRKQKQKCTRRSIPNTIKPSASQLGKKMK